jgi:single-stranded DNA-specific DHH superfamily exonuclease
VTSIVLTHGDIDGITSGAIDMLAFPGAEFYFSRPSQIHIDLQRMAKDQPEVVVISDIAVDATMNKVLVGIERAQGGGHPSAVGASMNGNDFPVFLERLAEQVQKST